MFTTIQVQVGILPASRAEEAKINKATTLLGSLAIAPVHIGRNL